MRSRGSTLILHILSVLFVGIFTPASFLHARKRSLPNSRALRIVAKTDAMFRRIPKDLNRVRSAVDEKISNYKSGRMRIMKTLYRQAERSADSLKYLKNNLENVLKQKDELDEKTRLHVESSLARINSYQEAAREKVNDLRRDIDALSEEGYRESDPLLNRADIRKSRKDIDETLEAHSKRSLELGLTGDSAIDALAVQVAGDHADIETQLERIIEHDARELEGLHEEVSDQKALERELTEKENTVVDRLVDRMVDEEVAKNISNSYSAPENIEKELDIEYAKQKESSKVREEKAREAQILEYQYEQARRQALARVQEQAAREALLWHKEEEQAEAAIEKLQQQLALQRALDRADQVEKYASQAVSNLSQRLEQQRDSAGLEKLEEKLKHQEKQVKLELELTELKNKLELEKAVYSAKKQEQDRIQAVHKETQDQIKRLEKQHAIEQAVRDAENKQRIEIEKAQQSTQEEIGKLRHKLEMSEKVRELEHKQSEEIACAREEISQLRSKIAVEQAVNTMLEQKRKEDEENSFNIVRGIKSLYRTGINAFDTAQKKARDGVVGAYNGVRAGGDKLISGVKSGLTQGAEVTARGLVGITGAAKKRAVGLLDGTRDILITGKNRVVNSARSLREKAYGLTGSLVGGAARVTKESIDKTGNILKQGAGQVTGAGYNLLGSFVKALEKIKLYSIKLLDALRNLVVPNIKRAQAGVSGLYNKAACTVRDISCKVKTSAQAIGSGVAGAGSHVKNIGSGLTARVQAGVSQVADTGKQVFSRAQQEIFGLGSRVKSLGAASYNKARELSTSGISGINSRVKNFGSGLTARVQAGVSRVADTGKKLFSQAKSLGSELTSRVQSGISRVMSARKQPAAAQAKSEIEIEVEQEIFEEPVRQDINQEKKAHIYDRVKNIFGDAQAQLKDLSNKVISGTQSGIAGARSQVNSLSSQAKSLGVASYNKAKELSMSGVVGIGSKIISGARSGVSHVRSFGSGLTSQVQAGVSRVADAGKQVFSRAQKEIFGLGSRVKSLGVASYNKARELSSSGISGVNTRVKDLGSGIISGAHSSVSRVRSLGSGLTSQVTGMGKQVISQAQSGASKISSRVRNFASNIISHVKQAVSGIYARVFGKKINTEERSEQTGVSAKPDAINQSGYLESVYKQVHAAGDRLKSGIVRIGSQASGFGESMKSGLKDFTKQTGERVGKLTSQVTDISRAGIARVKSGAEKIKNTVQGDITQYCSGLYNGARVGLNKLYCGTKSTVEDIAGRTKNIIAKTGETGTGSLKKISGRVKDISGKTLDAGKNVVKNISARISGIGGSAVKNIIDANKRVFGNLFEKIKLYGEIFATDFKKFIKFIEREGQRVTGRVGFVIKSFVSRVRNLVTKESSIDRSVSIEVVDKKPEPEVNKVAALPVAAYLQDNQEAGHQDLSEEELAALLEEAFAQEEFSEQNHAYGY